MCMLTLYSRKFLYNRWRKNIGVGYLLYKKFIVKSGRTCEKCDEPQKTELLIDVIIVRQAFAMNAVKAVINRIRNATIVS